MDSNLVKKWFCQLRIPEFGNKKLQHFAYLQWYFIDHRKIGDQVVFPILSRDEVGFMDLYYVTFDRSTNKFQNIHFVTQAGGDGGYSKEDVLEWMDDHRFKITSNEYEEKDFKESSNVVQHDSTITIYDLDQPKLKPKTIFKNTQFDTIYLKGL